MIIQKKDCIKIIWLLTNIKIYARILNRGYELFITRIIDSYGDKAIQMYCVFNQHEIRNNFTLYKHQVHQISWKIVKILFEVSIPTCPLPTDYMKNSFLSKIRSIISGTIYMTNWKMLWLIFCLLYYCEVHAIAHCSQCKRKS